MKYETPPVTPPIRLVKLPLVCDITTLSRASVYRLCSEGKFPTPLKLGSRASSWRLSDVENWIASRQSGVRVTT